MLWVKLKPFMQGELGHFVFCVCVKRFISLMSNKNKVSQSNLGRPGCVFLCYYLIKLQ